MTIIYSTKVLCEQNLFSKKIAKIQRSYVSLRGHTTFVLLTPARTMTINDKDAIYCNDVNKTSISVELLSINSIRYVSQRSKVGPRLK